MSVVNIPTAATGYRQSIIRDAQGAQRVVNRMQMSPTLNPSGIIQPLGRITNSASEFQKSMDASAARVFAFGAAVGVINGVSEAFRAMIAATAEVEKSLKDIQVVMEASNSAMQKFGDGLFDVARNTATSFKDVAESATELARQGLSAEETLARVNSALILSRLSGLDAVKSTETLTAAINSFNKEGITHSEIVNRMANVDAAFAVSSADLAEAISRAGAVAQSSGVSFNQLAAVVTAVQQRTARGGSVIGNGFKSIFTRIKRSGVREALEEIGVATKNNDGSFRDSMSVILDYADVYKNLSDSQKAYTAEQLAGVYQIQNLQALIQDLNSGYSIYNKALGVANNTTNEAIQRNKDLNTTLSAMFTQTQLSAKELASSLGELALSGNFKEILTFLNNLAQKLNDLLSEDGGNNLAKNLVRGIGSFLTGPGMVILGAAFLKIFGLVTKFAKEAFSDILGLNKESKRQQSLQAAIGQVLSTNSGIYQKILAAGSNTAKQEQIILNLIRQETAERIKQEALIKRIAASSRLVGIGASESGFVPMGKKTAQARGRKVLGMSNGFLPAFNREQRDINTGVGGARKSDKPVLLKNHKMGGGKVNDVVAHTGEWTVRNFKGSGGTAIFNRDMASAYGLPSGAKKINASSGFIPNFAKFTNESHTMTSAQLGGSQSGKGPISRLSDVIDSFTGKIKVAKMDFTNKDLGKNATDIVRGNKAQNIPGLIESDPKALRAGRTKYRVNKKAVGMLNKRYGNLVKDGPYAGIVTTAKSISESKYNNYKTSQGQPDQIKDYFKSVTGLLKGVEGEHQSIKYLANSGLKNVKPIQGAGSFDLSAKNSKGKKAKMFEVKAKEKQNVVVGLKKAADQYLKLKAITQKNSGQDPIGIKNGRPDKINLTSGNALFAGGINMLTAADTKLSANKISPLSEENKKFKQEEVFKQIKSFTNLDFKDRQALYKDKTNEEIWSKARKALEDKPKDQLNFYLRSLQNKNSEESEVVKNYLKNLIKKKEDRNSKAHSLFLDPNYNIPPGGIRNAVSGFVPNFMVKRPGMGKSGSVYSIQRGKDRVLNVSHIRANEGEFGSTIYRNLINEIVNAAKSGNPYTKIDAGSIIGPRIPRALLAAKKILDRKRITQNIPKLELEGVLVPKQLRRRVEEFRQNNYTRSGGKFNTEDSVEYLPGEESKLIDSLRRIGLGRNAHKRKNLVRLENLPIGKNFSDGFIPNFAKNALSEAINREREAGVPQSRIRVERSADLVSKHNPMGLAVTNTRDEPLGLNQGIRRAKMEGVNPKTYGSGRNTTPNFAAGVQTTKGFFTTQRINRLKDGDFAKDSSGNKVYLNMFSPDDQKKILGFKATHSKENIAKAKQVSRDKKNKTPLIDASTQATMLVATNNLRRRVDTKFKTDKGDVRLKYRVEGLKPGALKNTEGKIRDRIGDLMLKESTFLAKEMSGAGKFGMNVPNVTRMANAGSIGSAAGSIFETALQTVGKNKLFTRNNASFDIAGAPDEKLQKLFGYYTPYADAKIGLNPDTKRDFNQKVLKIPQNAVQLSKTQKTKQAEVSRATRKSYGPLTRATVGYIPNFAKLTKRQKQDFVNSGFAKNHREANAKYNFRDHHYLIEKKLSNKEWLKQKAFDRDYAKMTGVTKRNTAYYGTYPGSQRDYPVQQSRAVARNANVGARGAAMSTGIVNQLNSTVQGLVSRVSNIEKQLNIENLSNGYIPNFAKKESFKQKQARLRKAVKNNPNDKGAKEALQKAEATRRGNIKQNQKDNQESKDSKRTKGSTYSTDYNKKSQDPSVSNQDKLREIMRSAPAESISQVEVEEFERNKKAKNYIPTEGEITRISNRVESVSSANTATKLSQAVAQAQIPKGEAKEIIKAVNVATDGDFKKLKNPEVARGVQNQLSKIEDRITIVNRAQSTIQEIRKLVQEASAQKIDSTKNGWKNFVKQIDAKASMKKLLEKSQDFIMKGAGSGKNPYISAIQRQKRYLKKYKYKREPDNSFQRFGNEIKKSAERRYAEIMGIKREVVNPFKSIYKGGTSFLDSAGAKAFKGVSKGLKFIGSAGKSIGGPSAKYLKESISGVPVMIGNDQVHLKREDAKTFKIKNSNIKADFAATQEDLMDLLRGRKAGSNDDVFELEKKLDRIKIQKQAIDDFYKKYSKKIVPQKKSRTFNTKSRFGRRRFAGGFIPNFSKLANLILAHNKKVQASKPLGDKEYSSLSGRIADFNKRVQGSGKSSMKNRPITSLDRKQPFKISRRNRLEDLDNVKRFVNSDEFKMLDKNLQSKLLLYYNKRKSEIASLKDLDPQYLRHSSDPMYQGKIANRSSGFVPNFSKLANLILTHNKKVQASKPLGDKEYSSLSGRIADFNKRVQGSGKSSMKNRPITSLDRKQPFKISRRNRLEDLDNVKRFMNSDEFKMLDKNLQSKLLLYYNKRKSEIASLKDLDPQYLRYSSDPMYQGKIANYGNGFMPNFALDQAIARESEALKKRGVSSNKIKVEKSSYLKSAMNPMGLAVTNAVDEPMGVQQGINRVKKQGLNPKTYGVPSFALSAEEKRLEKEKADFKLEQESKRGRFLGRSQFLNPYAGLDDDEAFKLKKDQEAYKEKTKGTKGIKRYMQHGMSPEGQRRMSVVGGKMGNAAMGAMFMGPMAAEMIRDGREDAAIGGGGRMGMDVMNSAALGAAFGPWGMALGAGYGVGKGITEFGQRDKQANTFKALEGAKKKLDEIMSDTSSMQSFAQGVQELHVATQSGDSKGIVAANKQIRQSINNIADPEVRKRMQSLAKSSMSSSKKLELLGAAIGNMGEEAEKRSGMLAAGKSANDERFAGANGFQDSWFGTGVQGTVAGAKTAFDFLTGGGNTFDYNMKTLGGEDAFQGNLGAAKDQARSLNQAFKAEAKRMARENLYTDLSKGRGPIAAPELVGKTSEEIELMRQNDVGLDAKLSQEQDIAYAQLYKDTIKQFMNNKKLSDTDIGKNLKQLPGGEESFENFDRQTTFEDGSLATFGGAILKEFADTALDAKDGLEGHSEAIKAAIETQQKIVNLEQKLLSEYQNMLQAQQNVNQMMSRFATNQDIGSYRQQTDSMVRTKANDYLTDRNYIDPRQYIARDAGNQKRDIIAEGESGMRQEFMNLIAGIDVTKMFNPSGTQKKEMGIKDPVPTSGTGAFQQKVDQRESQADQQLARALADFAAQNKDGNVTLNEMRGFLSKIDRTGQAGNRIASAAKDIENATSQKMIAQLERLAVTTMIREGEAASGRLQQQGGKRLGDGEIKAGVDAAVESDKDILDLVNNYMSQGSLPGDSIIAGAADSIDAFRQLAAVMGVSSTLFTGLNDDTSNYLTALADVNGMMEQLENFDPQKASELKPVFEKIKSSLDADYKTTQIVAEELKRMAGEGGVDPNLVKDPIKALTVQLGNLWGQGLKITNLQELTTPLTQLLTNQDGNGDGSGSPITPSGAPVGTSDDGTPKGTEGTEVDFSSAIKALEELPGQISSQLSELVINHEVTGGITFDFNSDVVQGVLTPVMRDQLKSILQEGVILDYLATALKKKVDPQGVLE
jgi:TP901 family phage tail tape measure protein